MNNFFLVDIDELPFMFWIINSDSLKVKKSNKKAQIFSEDPMLKLKEKDRRVLGDLLCKKTEEKSLYFEFLNSEGQTKWIMLRIIHSPTTGYVHLTGFEVTNFEYNEFQLKQILDAIPDMILVKGENSKIIWANEAFQSYYNMTIKELQQLSIDADFNEPNYTQQYLYDDTWVWKNQKTLNIDCEPITRHDGVVRKFQTVKAPIFNRAGETQATVGISRDITDDIENRERSFASSKMASLGEMAGGISHEINNPLSIIFGRVGQIRQKFLAKGVPKNDEAFYYLQNVSDNLFRIVKIIEGLRNFSSGGSSELFVKMNIYEVVQQVLSYCSGRFSRLGIPCQVEIQEDLEAEIKEVPFSQILLNLLNNAIDAVEGQQDPLVKITARIYLGNLELRVSDSGPGVSEEIATKIMQPFFTTKPINKGTGLGLSISQTIAHHHGGSIKLDRSFAKSCFLLSFPCAQIKEESATK